MAAPTLEVPIFTTDVLTIPPFHFERQDHKLTLHIRDGIHNYELLPEVMHWINHYQQASAEHEAFKANAGSLARQFDEFATRIAVSQFTHETRRLAPLAQLDDKFIANGLGLGIVLASLVHRIPATYHPWLNPERINNVFKKISEAKPHLVREITANSVQFTPAA